MGDTKSNALAQAAYNAGLNCGRPDEAIAHYTEAIRLNPKFEDAYSSRGLSYLLKGNKDKAYADFDEVLRINPNNVEAGKYRSEISAIQNTSSSPKVELPKPPRRSRGLGNGRSIFITVFVVLCIIAVALITFLIMRETPDMKWYSDNPNETSFTISTAEELAWLAKIVNGTQGVWSKKRDNFIGKTITLAGNIDMSQYGNWVPIGNYSIDTNNIFSGTFNGGGYVISGLTINRPDVDRQGLFGRIDGGMVENLGLDNVNIYGHDRVGAVAGVINKGSRIINCYSTGLINGMAMVGGLTGAIADNSDVGNSYSTVSVNGDVAVGGVVGGINGKSSVIGSYSIGVVSGRHGVGGVVGSVVNESCVVGSYSAGMVKGSNDVGGVAGQILSKSNMANSYSTGTVGGRDIVGGVVGTVGDNGQVVNSYSTAVVSGDTAVGGVAGQVRGNSSVISCAALNSEVKGNNTSVGRVVGGFLKSTLSNNVAIDEMKNGTGNIKWTNKGAATINGANITVATIKRDGTIGGRFTSANGWTTQNGKLPSLSVVVSTSEGTKPLQQKAQGGRN